MAEQPKVYIETSVISYLTARPSADVYAITRQQSTIRWWNDRRDRYDAVVSELVLDECEKGDPDAAARRVQAIASLPVLAVTLESQRVAQRLMKFIPLPDSAENDALHIALALGNGIEFLMTWNLRHIASGEVSRRVELFSRLEGLIPPVLCTPDQLLE